MIEKKLIAGRESFRTYFPVEAQVSLVAARYIGSSISDELKPYTGYYIINMANS